MLISAWPIFKIYIIALSVWIPIFFKLIIYFAFPRIRFCFQVVISLGLSGLWLKERIHWLFVLLWLVEWPNTWSLIAFSLLINWSLYLSASLWFVVAFISLLLRYHLNFLSLLSNSLFNQLDVLIIQSKFLFHFLTMSNSLFHFPELFFFLQSSIFDYLISLIIFLLVIIYELFGSLALLIQLTLSKYHILLKNPKSHCILYCKFNLFRVAPDKAIFKSLFSCSKT